MNKKEPSIRRLLNIIKRMLNGEEFYSTISPKMNAKEYQSLRNFGFYVQSEWPLPPESRRYYAMKKFENENIILYEKLKNEK